MVPERASRSMTFAEKMYARASGKEVVWAGEDVYPDPSLVIIHDSYLGAAHRELSQIGYRRIANPDRVVAVTDHEVVYTTPAAIVRGRANRKIADEWRIGHFYDAGQGGHGHIFPMEIGLVVPGSFIAAYDMHCSNFGAIGAFAMHCSADVTVVLATGSKLTTVPETIRIALSGALRPGVHTRDIGFRLAHDLSKGVHGFFGEAAVVEFHGFAADTMRVADRTGLINSLTEVDVVHVLFPPRNFDDTPVEGLEGLASDDHGRFRGVFAIDLSEASPTVALPGAVHQAADISEAAGQSIDHAFIGACGSSQYDDFEAAVAVLRGRRIARGVRLFIVPGTTAIANRMMRSGLAQTLIDAGAIILPSGCGPCAGGVMGPLASGEVSISTAATNNRGRMGADDSECYLASPLSVAAAAVAGRIIDPREVMA